MAQKKKPASHAATQKWPGIGIGVVIWRDDKVLLIKRGNAPRKGEWGLPGGKQNFGETIMEAAVREAREETGLDIEPLGVITAIDAITRKGGKTEFHYTIVEVTAEAMEGKAKAGDDAVDICWAGLDEVEKLCKWQEVARVVRLSLVQRAL